jgi:hypothetical protein
VGSPASGPEPAPALDAEQRHLVVEFLAGGGGAVKIGGVSIGVGPAPVHARGANNLVLQLSDAEGSALLELDVPDPRFIRAYDGAGGSVDPVLRVDEGRGTLGVPLLPKCQRLLLTNDQGEAQAELDVGDAIYSACKQDPVGVCRRYLE